MTKKLALIIGGLCLVVLAGCGTYGYQQDSSSGYQQNSSNGGNWTVSEPQEVVVMPDSGVTFVPGAQNDVFFYNNYWWSQRGNQWQRSSNYNGPWESTDQRYVPAPVSRVPKYYRSVYEKQQHIPYGQWKKQGKNNKNQDKQGPGQGNRNNPGQGQN